jgi:hypothetical protein
MHWPVPEHARIGTATDFDSAMRRFESSRPSQLSYCSYEPSSFSILGLQEGLTLFIRRVDNFRIIFVLVTSCPPHGFAVWPILHQSFSQRRASCP